MYTSTKNVENTMFFGKEDFDMKRELTPEQKANLKMKYEIAEELGLTDKIAEYGWKSLTARESGKIGGIMGKKKKLQKQTQQTKS